MKRDWFLRANHSTTGLRNMHQPTPHFLFVRSFLPHTWFAAHITCWQTNCDVGWHPHYEARLSGGDKEEGTDDAR